jgi:hypothetical protein
MMVPDDDADERRHVFAWRRRLLNKEGPRVRFGDTGTGDS